MFRSLFTIALVFVLSASAAAQTAIVSGTVVDESGAVVPGATVTLAGPATTASATTGGRGEYAFPAVAAGTYRLTATLPGFSTVAREGIVVGTSNVEVGAIPLSLASLSDTVVVSASRSNEALIDAPATISVVTSQVLASTP